jgi:hypothetical protein
MVGTLGTHGGKQWPSWVHDNYIPKTFVAFLVWGNAPS